MEMEKDSSETHPVDVILVPHVPLLLGQDDQPARHLCCLIFDLENRSQHENTIGLD